MASEAASTGQIAPTGGTDPPVSAWISGVRKGDPRALEAMYTAWYERMVAMARAATRRDEAFSLDCVQDAMVKFINHPPTVANEAQLGAWLRRAILSAAIDRVRRDERAARRAHAAHAAADRASARDPAASAGAAEQAAWLEAAIAELSAADQAILRLRVGQDQTLRAIGDQSGMSPDAVHGKVRRMVSGLRSRAREIFR
ncbi:MAG: hypothetical protein GIKADHBN_01069 [Phycisphaerales bacterium]|nr:hypothetical protein [Phycisphaerales bacterium]MCK6476516.1 sigma-70 family RNA polymerase sigma factor [Phycisphaerales bacterium]